MGRRRLGQVSASAEWLSKSVLRAVLLAAGRSRKEGT